MTRQARLSRLFALAALALAAAAPALAATPVQLRPEIALHDGRVTLGDLFEGAGPVSAVVAATSPGQAVVMDAGRVQMLAAANGLEWSNATGIRRIIARAGLAPGVERAAAPSAAASGRPARAAPVLAWARDINPGEVIRPDDMIWSRALAGAPFGAPRDSSTIIGQAARRPLRAGMAVSDNDVAPAMVIKRDDLISVTYEADGIRLTLQGKAMGDAAAGDLFTVLNPASKKQIQALATGPGTAVAGPGAERLRASLAANPQFFASLR
jgi:flagella basal body P-ring formation protein FlgA